MRKLGFYKFLEGELFRLDYEGDELKMDGSGYKPHWGNNRLIGRVNKKTNYAIKNIVKILDEIGLAAHDLQFLVQEDGNVKIIDVGLYQLSAKAKEINAKILKVVLKNLHMLLYRFGLKIQVLIEGKKTQNSNRISIKGKQVEGAPSLVWGRVL